MTCPYGVSPIKPASMHLIFIGTPYQEAPRHCRQHTPRSCAGTTQAIGSAPVHTYTQHRSHSVSCSSQDGISAVLSNSIKNCADEYAVADMLALACPLLAHRLPIACPLLAHCLLLLLELSKLSITASQYQSPCQTSTHCSCHECELRVRVSVLTRQLVPKTAA